MSRKGKCTREYLYTALRTFAASRPQKSKFPLSPEAGNTFTTVHRWEGALIHPTAPRPRRGKPDKICNIHFRRKLSCMPSALVWNINSYVSGGGVGGCEVFLSLCIMRQTTG